ncbi:HPP family protein [Paenalcaligenes niemegkensis]|uniref:HPP family protein n=1 Tax=Paenalcaligenes niemegkensis TaxID=2895469 RepID=UPI001EE92381|nr:HPP family protein [Paenalcaligenes niemegkensis]MCQ9616138.1 HPP family protein [Paenalcaligenes niemegkensis]
MSNNPPVARLPKPNGLQLIRSLVGGTVGISLIAWLSNFTEYEWLMAPFGATCVLLFAIPDAPLAQPRNVIGGHLIAAFVGLLFFQFGWDSSFGMGLAVGLAIALMMATQTIHPPAGANPIVVLLSAKMGWSFLFFPVLIGAAALVLVAIVVNNIGRPVRWPRYWW